MLDADVLVLNKNWTPISVTTVRDAITKLFQGSARAVVAEDYSVHDYQSWSELSVQPDDRYIVTAQQFLRVPDVILLGVYSEVPKKVLAFSRANIYKRDKNTCQYCGCQPGTEELTLDHIVPKSKGGTTSWTNCVVACVKCNRKKADKTAESVGLKLRSVPIKPSWKPKIILRKVLNTPKNWDRFVSDAYWNAELID